MFLFSCFFLCRGGIFKKLMIVVFVCFAFPAFAFWAIS